jgi:hypothetical protein
VATVDKRKYARILWVEGPDDLFAIAYLMKAHVDWPHQAEQWPVFIESAGGVDKVLNASLTAAIKAAHITNFGVVLDADDYAAGRYQRIQQFCSALFPSMPDTLPVEGLVVDNG